MRLLNSLSPIINYHFAIQILNAHDIVIDYIIHRRLNYCIPYNKPGIQCSTASASVTRKLKISNSS